MLPLNVLIIGIVVIFISYLLFVGFSFLVMLILGVLWGVPMVNPWMLGILVLIVFMFIRSLSN
jgi:hypothetical protein